MLTSIFSTKQELWNINLILQREDDIEIEDDDDDEDSEGTQEKTPDLTEDVFKDDEDTVAFAECF